MEVLLAAGALLGAAILASELVRLKRRLPIGFRALLYTYGEFILLGYLLGGGGLNLLSREFLTQLRPFMALGVGMVGLFYGLQFDWRTIKRVSPRLFALAVLQALLTFAIVFAAFALLFAAFGARGDLGLDLAAALAAIASITAPTAISILILEQRPRGPNCEMLRVIASVDGVVGLVLFNLVLSWVNPGRLIPSAGGGQALNALGWFGLSCLIGLLAGLLFCVLFDRRASRGEMIVSLSGVVIFASGIAYNCGVSPLFVLLIAGVVLANYSHRSEHVYQVLGRLEQPAFIVFLVLVGALWQPKLAYVEYLVVAFIGLRILGKTLGFRLAARAVRLPVEPYPWLGLGLLSQGGLALAMIANLTIMQGVGVGRFESTLSIIQTVVLFSILLNEFVAPSLTRLTLRKAGEL
jgi:Kef-type K+ transport system membrane component KefB